MHLKINRKMLIFGKESLASFSLAGTPLLECRGADRRGAVQSPLQQIPRGDVGRERWAAVDQRDNEVHQDGGVGRDDVRGDVPQREIWHARRWASIRSYNINFSHDHGYGAAGRIPTRPPLPDAKDLGVLQSEPRELRVGADVQECWVLHRSHAMVRSSFF